MVCVNTHIHQEVDFTHFVEIPRFKCFIGTARQRETNRTKLYLIFHEGRIYQRNGINGTWDELSEVNRQYIHELVEEALCDHRIPRFTTGSTRFA